MIPVYLLYHINFNHLSLTFRQRIDYIEKYLDKILDAIIIPSNISICGEDLLLLKKWNYSCYLKLVNHPKLKFLLTPYNHILPHLFPESFLENVEFGQIILKRLITNDKLINVGYSPEVDLPPQFLLDKLANFWGGLVLGETRIQINNSSQETYPPLFLLKPHLGNHLLLCYLSRRYTKYRDYLHKYLRGKATKQDIYKAIIYDYKKYSQPQPLLLRIDLEALILNTPLNGNILLEPPIKQFLALQENLVQRKVRFLYISENEKKQVTIFNSKQATPSSKENYKWKNQNLYKTVNLLKSKVNCLKKHLDVMSLTCSDYYCTNLSDMNLRHMNPNYSIRITKTRRYRDQESKTKLNSITSKRKIKKQTSNPDMIQYFHHYQMLQKEALQYFKNINIPKEH